MNSWLIFGGGVVTGLILAGIAIAAWFFWIVLRDTEAYVERKLDER